MFILYPFLFVLDLAFTLFAMLFVNWWAPLFAKQGVAYDRNQPFPGPVLPNWLKWFDTFDAQLDVAAPGGVGTYWTRVKWLYRNTGYGFEYWILGVPFDPIKWTVKSYKSNGKDDFFFAVGPYGTFNLRISKFGWKMKLGWKAWNMYIPETGKWNEAPWGPEMRIPLTNSIIAR